MKTNAQGIANYLLDLAKKNDKEIKPLKLVKLVYITQGFTLALHNKTAFDDSFDKVEAWKYGPVVPSIYHEFKKYGSNSIGSENKAVFLNLDKNGDIESVEKPNLKKDKKVKETTEVVWEYYKDFTGPQLINITHTKGSPWSLCYQPYENNIIPNELIKKYYKGLIKHILDNAGL